MNKIKRIVAAWLLIFVILFNAVGCDLLPDIKVEGSSDINKNGEFRIDADLTLDMMVGDTVVFEVINTVDPDGEVIWTSTSSCATVENGKVTALTTGTTIIKATLGDKVDRVIVSIFDNTEDTPDDKPDDKPTDKPDDKPGDIIVGEGGEILLPNEDDPITSDPYVGVDKDEFYSTYSPAISYNDAYYRTQHELAQRMIYNGALGSFVYNGRTYTPTTADGLSLFHKAHKYGTENSRVSGTQANYFYTAMAGTALAGTFRQRSFPGGTCCGSQENQRGIRN